MRVVPHIPIICKTIKAVAYASSAYTEGDPSASSNMRVGRRQMIRKALTRIEVIVKQHGQLECARRGFNEVAGKTFSQVSR